SNHKNTPDAVQVKIDEKTIKLYEELKILNRKEIEARYEIDIEEYTMRIQIEGRVLGDIARNHVIPTAIRYQNILIENVRGLKEIYGSSFKKHAQEQLNIIEDISGHIETINHKITEMIDARRIANKIEDVTEKAYEYCNKVKPFFEEIRYHCDKLEILVDDELWTLTKYREL